jgi:hypothetical protein
MLTPDDKDLFVLDRREFGFGVLSLGAAVLLPSGCSGGASLADRAREEAAYLLGLLSYVYGYPLVMMEVTRDVLTAAPAPNHDGTAAPMGQFARMPHYVSPYFKNVVRISLNSLWTTGWLDLGKEPTVLSVPDTNGRYYVMSMMEMWTNVFGSAGKRTTGTRAGNFLIVGPNWHGKTPAEIKEVFQSPTRYAWILGQTQANGPSDFAVVNAIQAKYMLTPLSSWGKSYTLPAAVPVNSAINTKITPVDQVARMDAGAFFNRLALAMKDNPPAAADGKALARLRRLGIEPGKPFDIKKIDPAIARGLQRANADALTKMQQGIAKIKTVNGWIQPDDLGRYGTDYNTRAGITYVGLGADMPEDTIYPTAYVDGDGMTLDSANKYVMRYEKGGFTPTNATWSVSLYQGNFYLPNRYNKYAISPWMPLKYGPDGSLTIYMQSQNPGPDKEANWLPTPASGPFNITIRNYYPKAAALNGTYKNPPIQRVQ